MTENVTTANQSSAAKTWCKMFKAFAFRELAVKTVEVI